MKIEMKNKNQERQIFFKRVAIFLVVFFLAWFNLSRADLDGYNIFQDKDQDGLSDNEEVSYGTNPDKGDTDGDGYSDKVEIESGYDPLKASPGDKIVVEGESENNNTSGANLTTEFFKEIKNQKTGEAAILNKKLTEDDISEEELSALYSQGGEGDLESVIGTLVEKNLIVKNENKISEADIKILPKPEGTEDEIKQIEKEQIEKYMSSLLYILAVNRPFDLGNINELSGKISEYIYQLNSDIQNGNIEEVKKYKKTIEETFDQIKKLETPYVLADCHVSILNVYQTSYNEIDENKLLSDNDPLALLVYVSKIEAVLLELERVQQEMGGILKEYGIDSFDLSSVVGS